MNREKLIAAGIDYDDGLKRMSGNEALYEKFLINSYRMIISTFWKSPDKWIRKRCSARCIRLRE